MSLNSSSIGARLSGAAAEPGYGPALAGLRTFDALSNAVAARQDRVQRSVASALRNYPQPPNAAAPAGGAPGLLGPLGALGGALAGYLASDAGHAALGKLFEAASGLIETWAARAAGGAEQLPLPLDG